MPTDEDYSNGGAVRGTIAVHLKLVLEMSVYKKEKLDEL